MKLGPKGKMKKKDRIRAWSKDKGSNGERCFPVRSGDKFTYSGEWRMLRYDFLKTVLRVCVLCRNNTGPFHVDHIKPRSKYPELALSMDNLQLLCEACNLGKGNRDETDFRQIKPIACSR